MPTTRTRPRLGHTPAITITRSALAASELVYIATANKKLSYPHGKSRIVYIGTTKNGAARVASSAAWKGDALLNHRGIHTLEFYAVACPPVKKHKTWRKFERALLIRFRERFGVVPMGNKQGKSLTWHDEYDFVTPAVVDKTIDYYSDW